MQPNGFKLFVGLGNPGEKYEKTRHNIGFMAIQQLAYKKGVAFRKNKNLCSQIAKVGLGNDQINLVMPQTYMNESGKAIRAALDWFNLATTQLLVIVDDMDLPLGQLRLRVQGGSGGHNGLRSTIQHLNTQEFCRLRIGIGSPISSTSEERKLMSVSHVLGKFSKREIPIVNEVLKEVIFSLDLIQRLGVNIAGNHINSFRAFEKNI